MRNYIEAGSTKKTPQSRAIPGREADMTENNSGGVTFKLNPWDQLDRFLVLGAESNTYYAAARDHAVGNLTNVRACIKSDGVRAVNRIVEFSDSGRAPKNDPAIFALALAAKEGDLNTRRAAFEALPKVCRIGTHLFNFVAAMESLGGWGRGTRRAVARWYTDKDPSRLAYDVAKYQSRNNWSHRDVLRLAHPKPTPEHNPIFSWVVNGQQGELATTPPEGIETIWAYEWAKRAASEKDIVQLITDHNLPRECIPTEWLNSVAVWEALLEHMPMTAMIRNLAKMTSIGLIGPNSKAAKKVAEEVQDVERLRKARIHPIAVLSALMTYKRGRGVRGSLSWKPVHRVVDALDGAFYLAFSAVLPANKRMYLGLDVSGSMGAGEIAGVPGLNPYMAEAAMAMVTARTEKNYTLWGFSHQLVGIDITPKMRLDHVIEVMKGIRMGSTDCALPMLHAAKHNIPVDQFIVYTDNETWSGRVQPVQALQDYRQKMGIPAKLIVVGFTSTGFTIADPKDAGMMDIVGFDAAAPAIMSDFARD